MAVGVCVFHAVTLWGQEFSASDAVGKSSFLDNKERIVNFGLKGGFTSALFLVPELTVNGLGIEEVQNNYRIGYFGSIFMRINFGRHFLQPEMSYNVNRCDITFDKPLSGDELTDPFSQEASISSDIHSIDIPVIYGYNFIKQGAYSLGVFGGPKIRYILAKQSKVDFQNFDVEDIHETLRPFNICVTMGVAVTISRVFFDFRYDIGLHNMSKRITYLPSAENEGSPQGDKAGISFKRRDNVLSFSLGVFF